MYWNLTLSPQLAKISRPGRASPPHGRRPRKLIARKPSPKSPVTPRETKRELGTSSQLAVTFHLLVNWATYSSRPKPASFVRTRTEVATADSLLHDSPLMQPVTRPSAGSLDGLLRNSKEKSPRVHKECWRRRSSASLIFLIFNIFFHGKPSWLLCSCKSPGELGSRTSNTSSVPSSYLKMIVTVPSSLSL